MRHRGLEPCRERHDFIVGSRTTRTGIDSDIRALVKQRRHPIEIGLARPDHGQIGVHAVRELVRRDRIGDIDWKDQDGHATAGYRRLAGHDSQPPRLLRGQRHFAEDAAALEHRLEVDLLNELEPQLAAGHLACDQHDRSPIAIGLIEAVDEVKAAGPTAACDGRQAIVQQRLGLGRERAGFLVPHLHELNAAAGQARGKGIQRIPDDAVAMLDAGAFQYLDDDFRYFLAHGGSSRVVITFPRVHGRTAGTFRDQRCICIS